MATQDHFKNGIIFLTLGLLTVSAFFVGLGNFVTSEARTIDEVVYVRMGAQLTHDIREYHTVPYGRELAAQGRPLPDYFFSPLYKHPPLFTFLVALSMKIFGVSPISAAYVPLFFGALFIITTFYLAREILNDDILALLAAFFVWLDPFIRVSSQKVWMDTTLSFFMLLSLYYFVAALKRRDFRFFLGTGAALTLAMLSKYTAVLAWAAFVFYALVYNRGLWRSKCFVAALTMPFIGLLPWLFWNVKIYGSGLLLVVMAQQPHAVDVLNYLLSPSVLIALGLAAFAVVLLVKRLTQNQKGSPEPSEETGTRNRERIRVILLTIFITLLWPNILNSVQMDFVPRTSWRLGAFLHEPPQFYFGQLMDFSLLYLFAFLGIFFVKADNNGWVAARSFLLVVLLFFIVWKNYQSRYILSLLPVLIIYALAYLKHLGVLIKNMPNRVFRGSLLLFYCLVVLTIFLKLYFINVKVCFPNDLCYF